MLFVFSLVQQLSVCKVWKRVDGTGIYPWAIYPLFILRVAHTPGGQTGEFCTT